MQRGVVCVCSGGAKQEEVVIGDLNHDSERKKKEERRRERWKRKETENGFLGNTTIQSERKECTIAGACLLWCLLCVRFVLLCLVDWLPMSNTTGLSMMMPVGVCLVWRGPGHDPIQIVALPS